MVRQAIDQHGALRRASFLRPHHPTITSRFFTSSKTERENSSKQPKLMQLMRWSGGIIVIEKKERNVAKQQHKFWEDGVFFLAVVEGLWISNAHTCPKWFAQTKTLSLWVSWSFRSFEKWYSTRSISLSFVCPRVWISSLILSQLQRKRGLSMAWDWGQCLL